MKRLFVLSIVFAGMMVAPSPSCFAATIGWFGGNSGQASAILASGNTPLALSGLGAADLASIDVLWILNPDNEAYDSEITGNLGSISAFVKGGGVLSMHDRYVTDAAGILPGGGGIAFFRDFTDPTTIDYLTAGPPVTGPGGTLAPGDLSGGNSSSHGFATLGSLPAGAVAIFSRTDATQIVDFWYRFGSGSVYYSTIPLDYYLDGDGPAAVQAKMAGVYAPNELAFQASLGTPEPGTMLTLGAGALLAGLLLKKRML